MKVFERPDHVKSAIVKFTCEHCGGVMTSDELNVHYCRPDALHAAINDLKARVRVMEAQLAALTGDGK